MPRSIREATMCSAKGLLAVQDNFGHVAECACGTLHVTVGPMRVALDGKALRRLHELLGTAIEKLESDSEGLAGATGDIHALGEVDLNAGTVFRYFGKVCFADQDNH
jgi:hypothetical protein